MKFFINCLAVTVSLIISTHVHSSDDDLLDDEGLFSEGSALIEESNFQKLSLEMKQKSLGLVLMLHAEHCPYCKLMEDEILAPMVISGDYDNKVLLRKLQIDEARDVIDFSGKTVEPSDISDRYDASLTPTLVFLDHEGKEIVKKMIGINTVELFGAYLDEEIEKVIKKIQTSSLAGHKKVNMLVTTSRKQL